ncbi:MAG: hypothetical protein PHY92_07975 [Alphaproteobacteria bacterium]|nr:hypothetical protein [Alphaproteobacteria bacterium]
MSKFEEAFFNRHGEHGVQALLENWERHRGIRRSDPMPLERRWEIFMMETSAPAMAAA